MSESDTFHKASRGNFSSLLRRQQLDEFWNVVRRNAGAGWYLYAIGAPVPVHQSSTEEVVRFIAGVDKLLTVNTTRITAASHIPTAWKRLP